MTKFLSKKRGVSLAGFLPFMVVTGMLCGTVVMATVETRRASGNSVRRIQCRMAAEGAALQIARDSITTGTLTVGDCAITVTDAKIDDSQQDIGLTVTFLSDPMSLYQEHFTAVYENETSETRKFKGVYGGGGL